MRGWGKVAVRSRPRFGRCDPRQMRAVHSRTILACTDVPGEMPPFASREARLSGSVAPPSELEGPWRDSIGEHDEQADQYQYRQQASQYQC